MYLAFPYKYYLWINRCPFKASLLFFVSILLIVLTSRQYSNLLYVFFPRESQSLVAPSGIYFPLAGDVHSESGGQTLVIHQWKYWTPPIGLRLGGHSSKVLEYFPWRTRKKNTPLYSMSFFASLPAEDKETIIFSDQSRYFGTPRLQLSLTKGQFVIYAAHGLKNGPLQRVISLKEIYRRIPVFASSDPHSYVLVVDPQYGQLQFWIDGIRILEEDIFLNNWPPSASLTFGGRVLKSLGEFEAGVPLVLGNLGLWKVPLGETEIQRLHSNDMQRFRYYSGLWTAQRALLFAWYLLLGSNVLFLGIIGTHEVGQRTVRAAKIGGATLRRHFRSLSRMIRGNRRVLKEWFLSAWRSKVLPSTDKQAVITPWLNRTIDPHDRHYIEGAYQAAKHLGLLESRNELNGKDGASR